jgi:glycosyltransferase involved in cell wall biosynthesis
MKILQVLDSYPPDLNGGAYFIHRLSRELIRQGQEVLVICPSRTLRTHEDLYENVPLFRVRSYPALLYRNQRISWPLGIRASIHEAIRSFEPDVIHLQGRFFLGDICMRYGTAHGIPMVATNHFMPENFFHHTGLPRFLEGTFSRLAWRWVHAMFDRAQIWTTPTESAAALMRANGFDRTVHAISCGVDRSRFHPRERSAGAHLPFPGDSLPILLYAGRLDREKNLPMLLHALRQVLPSRPCHLVLVGDGRDKALLQSLAARLAITDHVHFAGRLSDEDYPLAFSRADCFVHAGTAELQSLVTLEAVASGLPIVAARAVALPELVREGANGFLFDPGNAEQAASHLLALLHDPALRRRMGEESLKLAAKHDVAVSAVQFIRFYRQLVSHV